MLSFNLKRTLWEKNNNNKTNLHLTQFLDSLYFRVISGDS